MSTAMRLDDLLAGHADSGGFADVIVRGLSLDSRAVTSGDAFVALQGSREHGIGFAASAFARGARIVLAETAPAAAQSAIAGDVLWIDGLREKLGAIAARFFGDPSRHLRVTGVTGTNGKTSIVQLLARAFSVLGRRSATIGTLGAGLHGALDAGERTTPDAISQQRLLARFVEQGASDVAMEVSSHALDQGRVNGIQFRIAVFTNLTRDHLDYHGDMSAYAAAKRKLFHLPGVGSAVINIDDVFGRSLSADLPATVACVRYAIDAADAEVRALDIDMDASGLRFLLRTPWGERRIESKLLGRFNVANLLAVAATLGALGHGFADIVAALVALEPVPGRMSRLGGSNGQPLVVIDYAHTPDALEQALTSLRAHCAGALVCVFGCGGERDAGKRPQMARIAERLADRVIVTDDNPRGEDGDAIVAAILDGFAHVDDVVVERDRGRAIQRAIGDAGEDDVVLIAGKGHEPYQEIGGMRHAFDDLEVARRMLGARAC
ncbi:MAG: UDP-N-acetylmuramoyl-L-alanyl-D-glutamate--2,6-diaminopimelate ligase [Dokdonella sp.]|uniref:UDP-N-acetylmuramoyl-L-alanyl-D-glutamate--2, 6-diaminopimelate ligase n=1 Tax=Dokdonella sp. TaxID=2291710 RepID=UPI002CD585F3|nr:UDP-N-acetylmuramoyl-L-alanyl-D-glutamate--2,6-diaminopimelate ligase [Xanthomonadales bacterium]HQW76360.1 UDP-N-acetylmuramoyl-L-alanyl-D-glutamate--2,6-diaminopimelate ligase [Dokdonella sp.]MBL0222335.1 UDP-N-acetylmuramoyl-L-alanyl-D-glutamate--2,6-diaminopimelate ligase [Xanthomonadales bacterium]HQX64330.1 UDP-N-acetylmuramoyl-L-alanyl-D-glutamate--2,6-diaminopimelate ligase [Dokdonella sp.]HQY53652.1 UDP-N-acetylmuramoyl-L-alanyl-D-glutamate--2,6-diaminopimelate ligase [Dokdonella sp